jgi:hypothetical protein
MQEAILKKDTRGFINKISFVNIYKNIRRKVKHYQLNRAINDAKKGKNVSKPYSSAEEMFNDIIK